MSSLRGDTFLVEIETAPDTFTAIGKCNAFDEQSTRQTTSRAYFGSATPDTTRGPRETTLTLQGTRDLEDAGQAALFGALETDPEGEVTLRIMYDDDSGYVRTFQINDTGHTTAPEDFQDFSLSLSPTGDKTPFTSS